MYGDVLYLGTYRCTKDEVLFMKTITYKITDPRGIHARPAGQLVKVIAGFACDCKMGKPDALIDGKRLLAVMKLAMAQGDELTLQFDGADEEAAAEAVLKFLQENL